MSEGYPEKDEFLTQMLGKPVYNLTGPVSHLKDNCLYRWKTTQPVQSYYPHQLVCTSIKLSRPMPRCHEWPGRIKSVPLTIAEREDTLNIAGCCFRYDSFHRDPKIEDQVADKLKRQWVLNCIMGERGDAVIAVSGGFICISVGLCPSHTEYIVDLIGVYPAHQAKGVGKSLLRNLICYARADGARSGVDRLATWTQLENWKSLKMYHSMGFNRIDGFRYVYHLHT